MVTTGEGRRGQPKHASDPEYKIEIPFGVQAAEGLTVLTVLTELTVLEAAFTLWMLCEVRYPVPMLCEVRYPDSIRAPYAV